MGLNNSSDSWLCVEQPGPIIRILLNLAMFNSKTWKDKAFKPYNFDAKGVPLSCGHLHPLMKVRTEIRQIFLEMG